MRAFLPENLERARLLIGALRDIASSHDATAAQVALAWVISHRSVVAIPGASTVAQLQRNGPIAFHPAFEHRDMIGGEYPVEVDETLVGGRTRGEGRRHKR